MSALAQREDFHAGAEVSAAFATLRKHIRFMRADRAMDADVQRICALVANGELPARG
jgi:histidine ammonia-lyase